MERRNIKAYEIAEVQSRCRDLLVGKLLDHVRLNGKRPTWRNCFNGRLSDGDGDTVLKVLSLGSPEPSVTLASRNAAVRCRVYCLYAAEDEFGRQFLMVWYDHLDDIRKRESLLNMPLAFVSEIADIVKEL